MIKKVSLRRFKQFKSREVELHQSGISLLVGGNNSGKTTLLHAFAVWEFCKTVIEMEQGKEALLANSNRQGVGLGDDEFSPVQVPSLKHLWTNLRPQKTTDDPDGYTLRICAYWDTSSGDERHLEVGMSLANDRLFVKTTQSTVEIGDHVPVVAYLPPFAGITDREAPLSEAWRRRLIGEGLAGAVLRNLLLQLFEDNQKRRAALKDGKSKISTKDLKELRQNDSWELLTSALRNTFSYDLRVLPFNPVYHSYIRIEGFKGKYKGGRFTKHPDYSYRDIMVEGSGLLQWLSVYTLAVDQKVDMLLLDEPDAHLHPSLQKHLCDRLAQIAEQRGKQILIATHSAELIRTTEAPIILELRQGKGSYLTTETQKVGLLAGLGTDYAPMLNQTQLHKRILFVEAGSDALLLRTMAETLGRGWPSNVVIWPWAAGHKERKNLFLGVKQEILNLRAVSLRDRDDLALALTGATLADSSHTLSPPGFTALMWRRRQIEGYLLSPTAIARAAGVAEQQITEFLANHHALAIPNNYTESSVPDALLDARAKEIFIEGDSSIRATYHISRQDVANAMEAGEICDDINALMDHLDELSS